MWQEIVFWVLVGLLMYSYVGYGLLLRIIASFHRKPVGKRPIEPFVTILISAYNEEKNLRQKLLNTLALDYPAHRREIVVVSDGSTDATDRIALSFERERVRLVRVEGRTGKTHAQNVALKSVQGEIVLFSDATTRYERLALRKLIRNFSDPSVGCVTGRLIYLQERTSSMGQGTRSYWECEVGIKKYQSAILTLTGATGCMYAVRKALYEPLPPDIISDLVEPLAVLAKGYRVIFEPEAIAYEEALSKEHDELKMRVRVITRGMRGLLWMRSLFNPLRHPYYFFQIVSHKVLRWFFFEIAVLLLIVNSFLIGQPLYAIIFTGQVLFYVAALTGLLVQEGFHRTIRVFSLPLYFCLINMASVVSLFEVLRGKKQVTWETSR